MLVLVWVCIMSNLLSISLLWKFGCSFHFLNLFLADKSEEAMEVEQPTKKRKAAAVEAEKPAKKPKVEG